MEMLMTVMMVKKASRRPVRMISKMQRKAKMLMKAMMANRQVLNLIRLKKTNRKRMLRWTAKVRATKLQMQKKLKKT